ncbi:MAG: serine/threonine-protein kinase, partial [Phycisphaerales bacterium]|nr:serine/threonine-protein kinase [Phycisphaerales bacterium]
MTPDWHRIQDLFHRASELEADAQEAFLLGECGDDDTLLSEVRSLLSAMEPRDSGASTTPMPQAKPPPDPMLGSTVERYTIKRVIGSGGMGIVYEAVQKSPRRTIALKMMKRGVTSKSALRRFEYEAQTLGRLRHEGIAQIFEAGTWDDGSGGRPWFAMEYLPGAKSITQYCDAKKLGTRERLVLFQKVNAAVQHGHQKGIIHRDLKPGNILVTSSGVPKVIDFGVARSTDSDLAVTTLQTDVGALIGTLQYMSPEQCDADPNDIDTRSDVYALGVVLYELLCGQPPYNVKRIAIHEAARIIKEEDPTKPSSIDKRLRGDIETITLKALEKDRDRRYQSTIAMEEDIARYLDGEPIAAKAPSAWDFMKRFGKRHKATATAIVAVVVVLVGAGAVSAVMWGMAEAANTRAAIHGYTAAISAAGAAVARDDIASGREQLQVARHWLDDIPAEDMPFEWQYIHGRTDAAHTVVDLIDYIDIKSSKIARVVYSADDTQLLVLSDLAVLVIDAKTGTVTQEIRASDGPFQAAALNRRGDLIATGDDTGVIRLWKPSTGEMLQELMTSDSNAEGRAPIRAVGFDDD